MRWVKDRKAESGDGVCIGGRDPHNALNRQLDMPAFQFAQSIKKSKQSRLSAKAQQKDNESSQSEQSDNVIYGTERDDYILGTDGDDVIVAGEGDDTITVIAGMNGNDELVITKEPLGNGQPSSCRIRTAPDFSMHSVDGLNSH